VHTGTIMLTGPREEEEEAQCMRMKKKIGGY
jgi:hypothetical protein